VVQEKESLREIPAAKLDELCLGLESIKAAHSRAMGSALYIHSTLGHRYRLLLTRSLGEHYQAWPRSDRMQAVQYVAKRDGLPLRSAR
jgi:hypothetical protein